MLSSKGSADNNSKVKVQTASQKRRIRRKKIQEALSNRRNRINPAEIKPKVEVDIENSIASDVIQIPVNRAVETVNRKVETMANDTPQTRDDVKAAREAKKLAKQQAKHKSGDSKPDTVSHPVKPAEKIKSIPKDPDQKSKDEVDRAAVKADAVSQMPQTEIDKELIKAERAAKKASKQAKKIGTPSDTQAPAIKPVVTDMTVKDVVETLRDIKNIALEVKEVTAKVQALDLEGKKDSGNKPEEGGKSKAQLREERRAKQEAQRAAKQAVAQEKVASSKPKADISKSSKNSGKNQVIKEKSLKPKPKQTAKPQGHRANWFRHLYTEDDKAKLNKIPINSNLHPAIIKLGVQLASRVVTGSNARCIALLDALKKMVRDYSLPAKTEFGRGLEAHLAASLEFLWGMRQPAASQTNAVKFFRHRLTQLPNNVDEFDAKKNLQEEIDGYIREEIDKAGEAISIAVRHKISRGDNILTYGCSSLIERILVEAHEAGVTFRAVVCGGGATTRGAREMTRRLAARGVPCDCVDITAIHFVMRSIHKVVVGACALLANGSVVGAAGTGAVALAARAANRPVLVACETHKFTDRVQTDAFVYNEMDDIDDLVDKVENSPLKGWRNNPNLTPLNLMYDVTPPTLVTAVVTELAILPCTSAPVVLRFKLSEYSIA